MKYPIGIQSFDSLISEGYVYIDKTDLIFNLATSGRYFFLSRPRRFGKSLLLSTLKAYFEGRRHLFDGLAISRMESEWLEYPVLRLDLNAEDYNSEQSLVNLLNNQLTIWEKSYGVFESESSLALRFGGVIRRAYEQTGRKVVILVDEYDKPLLQSIDNPELQERYRNILKAFYGNLKTCDQYIRFAFLTGVTKFGKISVFSDLNNLNDISLDRRFSTICGITEDEMKGVLAEPIRQMGEGMGKTYEEMREEMRAMYDGYHFSSDTTKGVYNPFSVINALYSGELRNYWFTTGTPMILVRQLLKTDYPMSNIGREEISSDLLGSIEVMSENPLPLMYQSGYLTIKGHDKDFNTYTLGYPNREVEQSFTQFLSQYYVPKPKGSSSFSINNFVRDVRGGNAESFVSRMVALFADGNYQVVGDREVYFQNTLYVFFKLMGFYVEVERHTSDGRMDVVLQTSDYIYIIELKVDESAAAAMQQIEEKQYALPFAADARRLYKIALNFNSQTRKIDDWQVV